MRQQQARLPDMGGSVHVHYHPPFSMRSMQSCIQSVLVYGAQQSQPLPGSSQSTNQSALVCDAVLMQDSEESARAKHLLLSSKGIIFAFAGPALPARVRCEPASGDATRWRTATAPCVGRSVRP